MLVNLIQCEINICLIETIKEQNKMTLKFHNSNCSAKNL